MSETVRKDLLRSGAALVEHGGRGQIAVTGADRASWLQGILTNDIESLTPGRGCYSAWLTPQGRMVTDLVVLVHDDHVSLDVPASLTDVLMARLSDAVFAEDVVLEDQTARWQSLGVHGVRAAEVAASALASGRAAGTPDAAALESWSEFTHTSIGQGVTIVRRDSFGASGYWLRVSARDRDSWMARLRDAGAEPASGESLEFARIEAGRPRFLLDMTTDTIPLEAGIEDRAISFTKGCYVGQEVVVRIVHRGGGRVAKRLVGLVVEGNDVPPAGTAAMVAGVDVGRVTSAAWSPRLARPVALAYLHRDRTAPGVVVDLSWSGHMASAMVRAFPLAAIG